MSSSGDEKLQAAAERPPTVNELTLMLVVWLGVSIAVIFTILRGWIRIEFAGRFQLDDIFVIFALLLLIASAVMYTVILKPVYQLSRVASGLIPPPATAAEGAKFLTETNLYFRVQFALTLAFWTCLWVVKASFLAFFYPLSNGLKWDRRLWYAVTASCVVGYIACVISYPVSCSEFTVGACGTTRNIELALVSLRMSTVFDILTDLAIMIIPWKLLWVVKLSRKEKLAIGSIVGLGIVIVVFAVIRIVVTNTTGTHPEVIWLALWSAIETSVAVVIVCLTSFKVFLKKGGDSSARYGNQQYPRGVGSRSGKDGHGGLRGAIPLDDQSNGGRFGTYNKGGPVMGSVERKGSTSNDSEEILVR